MSLRGFDRLIQRLRAIAAALPDRRTGANNRYSMADLALSASSVFFTQSSSFLCFQRATEQARGRHNADSLFGLQRLPADNRIRQTLEPMAPQHRFGLFDELHQAMAETGLLEAMRAVHHTRLIAWDGTGYFSSPSRNVHCPNCSCIWHAEGKSPPFHSAIPRSRSVPVPPKSCRCARSSSSSGWSGQPGLRDHRRQALAGRARNPLPHRPRHPLG